MKAARLARAVDPLGFALFVRMLGDAFDRHPKGLPDTELQRVFAAHRAALDNPGLGLDQKKAGHPVGDSQKSAGLRQLRPLSACGGRSSS